jgi:phosphonate transport system substrate-binding protein
MKKLIAAAVATAALLAARSFAQEITEFRIGILGGENAQDRLPRTSASAPTPRKTARRADQAVHPGRLQRRDPGPAGRHLDMAWLGASAYAKVYLTDPDAVEPVLVKTNLDGSFGYYSIGFARADSGITSLEDMKGKVFAFGDPNSTSGYLIPNGRDPRRPSARRWNRATTSARCVSSGGHEQTIVAVANGDVDGRDLGRRPGRLGRRLQLGRAAQGRRCRPRRHERARRDLALQADPGRPDRAAQGAARAT